MAAATLVRLTAIGYQLGAPRAVRELPELIERRALLDSLTGEAGGLRDYAEHHGAPLELAEAAARKTLACWRGDRRSIGAVILATDSLPATGGPQVLVGEMLARLGLAGGAYMMRISLAECANSMMALRTASALVAAGEHEAVLVISFDVAPLVSSGTRVVSSGIGIMSDAAAAVIVERGPGEGYLVRHCAQYANPLLGQGTADESAELRRRLESYRAVFRTLLRGVGMSARQVTRVFPNNFIASALQLFLKDAGFGDQQIFLDNLARTSHCLGSDSLIGLADQERRDGNTEGERYILLGAGITQLGGILVESSAEGA